MFGDKTAAAANRVTLETKPGGRDFDLARALVTLSAGSQEQQKLWDVMDQACLDLSDLVGRPGEI